MPYSLGVDLGASFTAVAIADDLGTHAAQLSPLLVVPSAVYVSTDGSLLTGDAALRAGESDSSRLVRRFKKRLGDPTPLIVAGVHYTPEQLMAAQLRDVIAEVAEQRGHPAETIVLTYPVTWGPYRAEHFARIADLSGIEVRAIITEPVATATHLHVQGRVAEGDIVAIVDFGNDAVTVTLLRKGTDGFGILGTPEDTDHVGSVDFDDAMRTLLDQKLGGMISALDPSNPAEAALLVAIDNTCSAAKETLSMRRETAVSVALPDGVRRVTVTREEFTRLIRPSVRLAVAALRRTIGSAEIDDDAITSIVLTGGASRIPVVAEELSEINRPVSSIHHPKLTVALGAAHTARKLAVADALAQAGANGDPTTSVDVAQSLPARRNAAWPLSRRALISIGAAVLVVLAVVAAAFVVPMLSDLPKALPPAGSSLDEGRARSTDTQTVSPEPAPNTSPSKVFPVLTDGETAADLRWYVSSAGEANDWGVAAFGNEVAEMPGIQLKESDGMLRAEWSSPDWLSQFYVQLHEGVVDLEEIQAANGALVFDLSVLSGTASVFQVSAHCTFPCAASVDITDVVRDADRGTTTEMVVPAECFSRDGLDIEKVNTPFLLIGQGDIAVSVGNIRWESDSGKNSDALNC